MFDASANKNDRNKEQIAGSAAEGQ